MTTVNSVGVSLSGQTGTGSFAGSTSPTFVGPLANNFLEGYSTTVTAAATTTLTASSNYFQFFTGTTTQTVALPVTSTLVLGQSYYIVNNSTGVVTVQSSGANTIQAMAASSTLLVTCILTSGTTAASWNSQYLINADLSGAVLLAPSGDQTIVGAHNLIMATGNMTASTMLPGNLSLTGNTLSSTNANGNVNVTMNGSGLFNVGTTTALNSSLMTLAENSLAASLSIGAYINSASGPTIYCVKSRNATVGGNTAVQSNDVLMTITSYGSDGTTLQQSSEILSLASGTVSAGIVPSNMTFKTTDTSGSLNTALTIDNAQIVTLAHALPVTSGGTGLTSTTINQLLYSSANNTIAGLATANNGILVTSAGGVPSIGNTVGAGLTMPSITFNTTTGIVGTTTNNNAAAGSVGEFFSSVVNGVSGAGISTGTPANVTSINLTAGDWDVWGLAGFNPSAGTIVSDATGWVSSTSATQPDPSLYTGFPTPGAGAALTAYLTFTVPQLRFSLSTTTTIYLSVQASFSVSALTAFGAIYARRVR